MRKHRWDAALQAWMWCLPIPSEPSESCNCIRGKTTSESDLATHQPVLSPASWQMFINPVSFFCENTGSHAWKRHHLVISDLPLPILNDLMRMVSVSCTWKHKLYTNHSLSPFASLWHLHDDVDSSACLLWLPTTLWSTTVRRPLIITQKFNISFSGPPEGLWQLRGIYGDTTPSMTAQLSGSEHFNNRLHIFCTNLPAEWKATTDRHALMRTHKFNESF